MRIKTPNINAMLRKRPRPCVYGAPLGMTNYADELDNSRVYLQRVRMIDGDYSADGTYWGGGRGTLPLWCAFTVAGNVQVFIRAQSRKGAMAAIPGDFQAIKRYIRATR